MPDPSVSAATLEALQAMMPDLGRLLIRMDPAVMDAIERSSAVEWDFDTCALSADPIDDDNVAFSAQMLLVGEPRPHSIDPGSDLAVHIEGTAQRLQQGWQLTDVRVEHTALLASHP